MASPPAHDLDVVKNAINDLWPDKPDVTMHITDDELQRLFDEGYTKLDNLKDASMQSLRYMGLRQACIDISLARGRHMPSSYLPRARRLLRVCTLCASGCPGDEQHVVFECPGLQDFRDRHEG